MSCGLELIRGTGEKASVRDGSERGRRWERGRESINGQRDISKYNQIARNEKRECHGSSLPPTSNAANNSAAKETSPAKIAMRHAPSPPMPCRMRKCIPQQYLC